MNGSTKRGLILSAGAVAGGWGGAMAMARIGAAYGLRLGPMGTIAGAAVGALLGANLSKMLVGDVEGGADQIDFEGEQETA